MSGREEPRAGWRAIWSAIREHLLALPSRVLTVLAVTFGLVGGWLASTRVTYLVMAVAVLVAGLGLMGVGLRAKLDAADGGTDDQEASDRERRRVRGEFAVDAGIALTTGAVVGVALLLATWNLEESLATREASREDVRFVREVATQSDATTKPFDGLDLSGAQLGGLDLSNAHMSRSVLVDAELGSASLHNAILTRADLSGAGLRDADLRNANLNQVDLADADLSNADLSPTYLYRADLSGADLSGVDLSGADLTRADLSGADLRNADLSGTDLTDVSLEGANLAGADLSDAFVADDDGADFRRADFSDANLRDADLAGVDLSEADLSGADLTGATLRDAILDDIARDEDTTWPDGFRPPRERRGWRPARPADATEERPAR